MGRGETERKRQKTKIEGDGQSGEAEERQKDRGIGDKKGERHHCIISLFYALIVLLLNVDLVVKIRNICRAGKDYIAKTIGMELKNAKWLSTMLVVSVNSFYL